MECWLVRHGQSTWNSVRRLQGGRDAPLSARGGRQAAALAAGLARIPFDGFYTSPLRRARDTAAACQETVGLKPVILEALREVGLGTWEGLTVDTVLAQDGPCYRRWREAPVDHTPPGGEPMIYLLDRVRVALDELGRRHADGRILVASHGAAIASTLCEWLGRPLNAMWSVPVDNASITRVILPVGRLLGINETGHLTDWVAEPVAP